MIRIPLANERSARIEVRSVAPDANPYLLLFSLISVGLFGEAKNMEDKTYLPDNIYTALDHFMMNGSIMKKIMGEEAWGKYAYLKTNTANRCPKALGTTVKPAEIIYHHEVYTQSLWDTF